MNLVSDTTAREKLEEAYKALVTHDHKIALGIGTAIRPAFTDIELSLMGPTARAIVTAPREKLWPSVKESLTVAPKGLALELLSSQHSSSLSILSPYAIKVPKQWLVQRDPNRLI